MTKFRKVFYTIGILVIIFLCLWIIREIFILKPPPETQTLWEKWTQGDRRKMIEEKWKALKKTEKELEELKKVRKQLEELGK